MQLQQLVLISLLMAACSGTSLAQTASNSGKSMRIERTAAAPVIDGNVDIGEWSGATRVSDVHQVIPIEFSTPSERTEWFLSYDDNALYVAAIAYDSDPDEIVARILRQGGSITSDDSLHILVDAFNNKRSGYTFALNANSVRYDAIFTDGTRQSADWEGIWRGASRRDDGGWSIEMAIPFTTLNFDPNNGTWGLNLWRRIARRNETIAWQSQNGSVNPTASGEVSGFKNLSQGKGIDVIPSLSSTYIDDREAGSSEGEINPSLDINYKFRNAINALITINTDFAATEVDDRQLGLERFSLFFPEKRSFFLTDFDIFQFGGVPTDTGRGSAPTGVLSGNNGLAFFSRRIGLSATREPVDIIAGTKLSGRAGDFDFGTLYIRQDEFGNVSAKDLMVARLARGVFTESSVGAIATYGDPSSNADNSLVGADFLYRNTRISGNRSLESQWWIQKSNDDFVSGDNLAWNASISLPAREGWAGGAQYHVVEENFRPALGFANRTGVRLLGAQLSYNYVLADPGLIREFETEIEVSRWEYLDTGRVQSQEVQFDMPKFRSVAGDFARMGITFAKEGLLPGEQPLQIIGILIPPGEYSFERYGFVLSAAEHRKVSGRIEFETGGYYNGDMFNISPKLTWRPNEHFGIEFEYDYNQFDFPGVSEITRQLALSAEFAFDSRFSLTTLAQYDNISSDVGINARLRFNIEAGQDIWLVLNHNMVEDLLDNRFHSTTTAAAIKIRYTFRY